MKRFARHKPNRMLRWTGTLAVLAAVFFYPLGSRAQDLSLSLFTDQAALDYPLGTPIKIMLVIKNDTGFELNTDKGFAQAELQKGLTLTTPSGERQRYTDEDLAFDMPPPIFINDLVAVPVSILQNELA